MQQRGERDRRQHLPELAESPVSCVISGTCRAGNQAATTESTLMNVNASPAPTSTRAAIASGSAVGQRQQQLARAMVSAPTTTSVRAPKRSSSTPTGTCRLA